MPHTEIVKLNVQNAGVRSAWPRVNPVRSEIVCPDSSDELFDRSSRPQVESPTSDKPMPAQTLRHEMSSHVNAHPTPLINTKLSGANKTEYHAIAMPRRCAENDLATIVILTTERAL